jgi:hypothetical protein
MARASAGALEDAVDPEEASLARDAARDDAEGEEQGGDAERNAARDGGIDEGGPPLARRRQGVAERRGQREHAEAGEQADPERTGGDRDPGEAGADREREQGAGEVGRERHPEERSEDGEGHEGGDVGGAADRPGAEGDREPLRRGRERWIEDQPGDAGREPDPQRERRDQPGVRHVDGEAGLPRRLAGGPRPGGVEHRRPHRRERGAEEAEGEAIADRSGLSDHRAFGREALGGRAARARGWAAS